jgi:hypothetical protein
VITVKRELVFTFAALALWFSATSLAAAAGAQPTEEPIDRCGTITGFGLGDLPSGGSISIGRDTFLVGGVFHRGSFRLPPLDQIKVGATACFKGIVVEVEPEKFDVRDGVMTVGGLPTTSTDAEGSPVLVIGMLLLASGATPLWRAHQAENRPVVDGS